METRETCMFLSRYSLRKRIGTRKQRAYVNRLEDTVSIFLLKDTHNKTRENCMLLPGITKISGLFNKRKWGKKGFWGC